MPFYETIFETGEHSVAEYADDDEALSAARAHHERATKGEPGRGESTPRNDLGEDGQRQVMDYPAERVVKLLKYDEHPATYMEDATLSTDVLNSELKAIIKNIAHDGVVNLFELESALRMLTDASVPDAGRHESMYKMKEVGELTL